jgi:hypothetical protein
MKHRKKNDSEIMISGNLRITSDDRFLNTFDIWGEFQNPLPELAHTMEKLSLPRDVGWDFMI